MQRNIGAGPNSRARDIEIIKSKVNHQHHQSGASDQVEQKEQGNSCHLEDPPYLYEEEDGEVQVLGPGGSYHFRTFHASKSQKP
jgi:hypothetical protein